jgi:hypothetical protein
VLGNGCAPLYPGLFKVFSRPSECEPSDAVTILDTDGVSKKMKTISAEK